MKNILLYGFVLLILPATARAQADSARYLFPSAKDSNNSIIRFERNLNTYLWNLKADYAQRNDEFSADVHDRYSSSFIRRDQNSRRDEHTLWLNGSQKISSALAVNVEASSFILSDNQSLGVSNAALHSGLLGLSIRPLSHFSFTPLVGFRFDRQQDEKDQGWNYKVSSASDTIDIGSYETQGSMRLNVSNLSPRYFRNNAAQVFVQKSFVEGSLDSLRFQWSNNRWDFYERADNTIQREFNVSSNIRSRVDENINVSNSLHYGIGNNLSGVVRTLVETRTIGNAYRFKSLSQPTTIPYNIAVQEQRLEGGADIDYRNAENLIGSVGVRVGERDERHVLEKIDGVDKNIQENRSQQEQRLDNIARRTSLRGSFAVPLSATDRFWLESSAGILRYDTPDSTNNDDRDELLINLAARESHRWSEYLEMNIVAEATLSHIVYLFKERSANNNWNRIFRLSPELTFTPSDRVRMFNAFEVLANYTVFDFESLVPLVPTVKSYLYRQFAFLDSTSYDMSSNVGFDFFFHVRLYERGEFHWQEFSERPQQYVREVTFSPALRYTIDDKLVCAVGLRSFAQNRFRYDAGMRTADGNYFSYGPTTSFLLILSAYSRLEIQGWKEFQQQTKKEFQQQTKTETREVSNVAMSVRVFF
jgi:hypothetical protein